MDELDLRILKEIGRDHILGWGSLDPRLTAAQVADAIGVARSTVSARLRAWEESGFLVEFVALPHAGLLGARLGFRSVLIPDPEARQRAIDALSLVDGFFACLEHVGGWLAVGHIFETEDALERRLRFVDGFDGIEDKVPPAEWDLPRTAAEPTTLDWQIVKALVDSPRSPIHELAAAAGVSVRTFRRRYQRLVEEKAVWLTPALDFTRWTGSALARFLVTLREGATGRAFDEAVTARHPLRMYMTEPPAPGPSDGTAWADVMIPLPSPAALDDVLRELAAMEGVQEVEGLFPRRGYIFPGWFRARVRERLA